MEERCLRHFCLQEDFQSIEIQENEWVEIVLINEQKWNAKSTTPMSESLSKQFHVWETNFNFNSFISIEYQSNKLHFDILLWLMLLSNNKTLALANNIFFNWSDFSYFLYLLHF